MNQYQEQGYRNDAKKIESEMRENGYLATDIVAVAYFLLKDNLDSAKELEGHMSQADKLIKEAEALLKKI